MIRGRIRISRSSRLVSSRTAQYEAVMYNGRILKLSVPPTDFTCIESRQTSSVQPFSLECRQARSCKSIFTRYSQSEMECSRLELRKTRKGLLENTSPISKS